MMFEIFNAVLRPISCECIAIFWIPTLIELIPYNLNIDQIVDRSIFLDHMLNFTTLNHGFRTYTYFLRTKENVQFLDVFCIFQCQQNKGFSHFLDRDSKLTVYRDGVVRPSRKDNILLPVVFDEFLAMP
jgi:hypothetical protein